MRIAFDSNVLIYLANGGRTAADQRKVELAQLYFLRLQDIADLIAPIQAIGEALRILRVKFAKSVQEILDDLDQWENGFELVPTSAEVLQNAVVLAEQHRLQHWDAIIVAAAVSAKATILLSEDMQDGFVWRGLTIVNPFADPLHPLLASLLDA